MKFPTYWTKGFYTGVTREGKKITFYAFGWSSVSMEDARHVGEERARRSFEAMGSDKRKEYEYGNDPYREEIIQRIELDGSEIGVISRNRYGALVLNTAGVMFADVDFPEIKNNGIVDAILSAFSKKRREEKRKKNESLVADCLKSWQEKNKTKSFRIYRTDSGFRVIFTDAVYDPKSKETKAILQSLGSDPLYQKLTEKQECFRARLTPKPWRCKSEKPPNQFPWDTSADEIKYREWEKGYHMKINGYTTCMLTEEYGTPKKIQEVSKTLEIHDRIALRPGKPLA